MLRSSAIGFMLLGAAAATAAIGQTPARVDLTHAVVVTAQQRDVVETNASRMLVEEVAKRTGVTWETATEAPATGAVIFLGTRTNPPAGMPEAPAAPAGSEGYVLRVAESGGRPVVIALGNEPRGAVFAVGRLLREMWMSPGKAGAPLLDLATAPAMPLRGHQIGYRPTPNSYDLWDPAEFEQYVRDMIVWGTNAVELIPTDSGMPFEKTVSMNAKWSKIIHDYGLEVWLWYPLDDEGCDLGTTAGYQKLMENRRKVFAALPYIDVDFIPGGDPGGKATGRDWADTMIRVSADIADVLHEHHPKAQVWLSNQGFSKPDNERFYKYLQTKQPKWLNGMVYGPWAEETIQSMREKTPPQYPIRQYPDITHAVRCQFPARDWDVAYAQTLGREPPMYRLDEEAHIARMYQKWSCGALTYSEGINDDLHKMVWSAELWDPKTDPLQIAHEYARYFFGADFEDEGVQGLLGLEHNWEGPLLTNDGVEKTYNIWLDMEKRGGTRLEKNWRFIMALMSATYDRYIQLRLQSETKAEHGILSDLASDPDPAHAVTAAIVAIDKAEATPVAPEMKQRLMQFGQAMHDLIGMQLSVKLWGADGEERGAIMDFLDAKITNLAWMKSELQPLQGLAAPGDIRKGIDRVVKYEDPGPGGFYDDLGDPSRQPHLVHQRTWEQDPGYVDSPRCDFAFVDPGQDGRMSWIDYAETLYGTPIVMHYDGLDPNAQYVVRAVYAGRYRPTMTLTANDRYRVHGPVKTPGTPKVMEWPVPKAATASGQLTLRWDRVTGRGCQVSEVWLLKK